MKKHHAPLMSHALQCRLLALALVGGGGLTGCEEFSPGDGSGLEDDAGGGGDGANDTGGGGTDPDAGGGGTDPDTGGGGTDTGGGGTDTGGGGTDTGGGGGGGTDPTEGRTLNTDIQFQIPSREIQDGAWLPISANGIKPYSFSLNAFPFANRGSQPVTVEGVILQVQGGFRPENWLLKSNLTEDSPDYVFAPFTLESGEGTALNTMFRPVQTATVEARVILLLEGNQYAEGRIRGRGRDAAFIVDGWSVQHETGWGHTASSSRILAGGMVVDDAGNTFLSGNANQWIDNINHDIAVARINPDGSEAWARVWHEEHQQEQPDSGQNNQTGGVSRSIARAADGAIFVIGKRSLIVQNNRFDGVVLKVNPDDGSLDWAVAIRGNEDPGLSEAQIYAVDATIPGRVLVTGTINGGSTGPFLAALDAGDGSLLWVRGFGLNAPDRAYTVRAAADGTGYVGGWTSSPAGFVARWTGLDGDDPQLAWAQEIAIPRGSLVQDIDMDPTGNAYIAYDIRGALTYHQLTRFNVDGTVAWNAVYNARERSDRQTTSVIRWHEGEVWAGGLLSSEPFDTSGDGFVLNLNADDGAYNWLNVYYTGTTASTQVEHRVKGIGFHGDDVIVLQQHYTGARNLDHYWGFWYRMVDQLLQEPFGDGSRFYTLENPAQTADVTEAFMVEDLENVLVVSLEVSASQWQAAPPAVGSVPVRERTGNGGHYQSFVTRVTPR